MEQLKTYRICNAKSAQFLGDFIAGSPGEAIGLLCQYAGYDDSHDACRALGVTYSEMLADLIVSHLPLYSDDPWAAGPGGG
jgi:hypothetical protein